VLTPNAKPITTKVYAMSSLASYLQSLNSAESQWGIWVNPENPTEEHRIGQYCFENGGLDDGWVCIGSLDNLSFGFQSTADAIEEYLESHEDTGIEFNGGLLRYNTKGMVAAWSSGYLDDDFQAFLESEAATIEAEWAECEAEEFVAFKLPDILEAAAQSQAEYEAVYA
jgi:hypothetical protein